jgi:hypothetical protein
VIDYFYRLRTDAFNLTQGLLSTPIEDLHYEDYYSFSASRLGHEEWLHHRALASINAQFPIRHAGILKMEPHTGYDWHTDTDRALAINMLLDTRQHGHPSETLFSPDHGQAAQFNVSQLVYSPFSLYLFNTQVKHTVINHAEPRYLFSVEFEPAEFTNYGNVLNFCLAQGL